MTIGENAFQDCICATSIIVKGTNNVVIEDQAFKGCSTESNATLELKGNNITIGVSAFEKCTKFTSIIIEGIDEVNIGNYAFTRSADSTNLNAELELRGKSVTVGNSVFSYCKGLVSAMVEGTDVVLGSSAFDGCESITQLFVEGTDSTSFGNYAFENCKSLTSYTIPGNLETISEGLFSRCSSLNNFVVPVNITKIEKRAFEYCTALGTVDILNDEVIIDGYRMFYYSGLKSITLPSGMNNIAEEMFSYCHSLESILTPDNSEAAKENTVYIPSNITEIGARAFERCYEMHYIIFLHDFESTSLVLNEGVFKDCTGLESIVLPNEMSVIKEGLFNGCSSLKSVSISGNSETVKENTFYISSNITEIGTYAFRGCHEMHYVIFLHDAESSLLIRDYAFQNCTGLKEVEIPSAVDSIGRQVFQGCTSLEKVKLPPTLTSIGDYAFQNCAELSNVEFSYNAESPTLSIGARAFQNCTGLMEIEIPSNVNDIKRSPFDGCTGLSIVKFLHKNTPPTITNNPLSDNGNTKCYFIDTVELTTLWEQNNIIIISEPDIFENFTAESEGVDGIRVSWNLSNEDYDAFNNESITLENSLYYMVVEDGEWVLYSTV